MWRLAGDLGDARLAWILASRAPVETRVVEGVESAVERADHAVAGFDGALRVEEPFWPAQIAVAGALVLYLTLPNKLVIGPQWLIPGVEGVLLVGLVISTPTRHHDQSPTRRAVVIALLALVSATTLVSLVLLTHFLLQGGKAGGHPLILAGIVLWATNVLIFGSGTGSSIVAGRASAVITSFRDDPTSCFRKWPNQTWPRDGSQGSSTTSTRH